MTQVRSAAPRMGVAPEQAASVPLPPRARKRWGLFAAGILVVCIGVLGSVWLYRTTTTAVPVVAAARTIDRGTEIKREDLVVVRVEKDVALHTVSGDDVDSLVGQRALLDVAEGSLVAPGAVGKNIEPGRNVSRIAVPVNPAMVPTGLVAGDAVRFVLVDTGNTGPSEPVSATVVEVRSASSSSAKVVVEVTVPESSAAALASLVGNDVAVILDSRER